MESREPTNAFYIDQHIFNTLKSGPSEEKVILAGPLTDKTGSLIVVEAETLEEVQAFAKEDPYHSWCVSGSDHSSLFAGISQAR